MSDAYRQWSPAAQQRALAALQAASNTAWRPFYCGRGRCDGMPHDEWEWNHARADQHPPADRQWVTWLMLGGRGGGKTRAGAEYVNRMSDVVGRIAIVAATGADARDTMLEGESGILTIAPPGRRAHFEPSKRRLTWPNGCVATTFSDETPDRLRGPEHAFAWVDEACYFPNLQTTWDNLLLGLRIGARPRVVVTSTPKPRAWLRDAVADARCRISRASTYDNLPNLAPTFAETIIARYEGTRLGRQELHAEILEDVEGALWSYELIERTRVPFISSVGPGREQLERVVVAIDPPGGSTRRNDEAGIVVAGRAAGHLFCLADLSGRYSPHGWATAAMRAHDEWSADAIIAERNYGGEMVASTLRLTGFTGRLITVHAHAGKDVRAEPIVGLFEQAKAHLAGSFAELETQLTGWVPGLRADESPDRLDAMVYAMTALAASGAPATIASPTRYQIPARSR